jgi:nitrilase
MRIAAAQTANVWGDPGATTDIVVEWIGRAADEGVDLLAFGETFLSGYPFWVGMTSATKWNNADQKAAYAHYLKAAVRVDGPEVAKIAQTVAASGVFTYLGITERSDSEGTVYASYLAIDPVDGVVSAHRKLTPTYDERMVWGSGDGHGLRVHQVGEFKVSGLNCWENWVPGIRHALYAQGTQLHVAGWPGSDGLTEDITRFIALEGRCYVLSAAQLLSANSVPEGTPLRGDALRGKEDYIYPGGSAIAAPDGSWIVKPVYGEEALVTADVDVDVVRGERQNFDPAGHYFRPDVIDVKVDRSRRGSAEFLD